jgi:hypothetical protein
MTRPSDRFSVDEIPFSYYGSWLDLSPVTGNAGHAEDVHVVSHQGGMHPVLRLVPQDGSGTTRTETQVWGTPARLTWTSGNTGYIEAVFEHADTLRLHGRDLGLLIEAAIVDLTPFSGTYLYRDPRDQAFVFTSYETGQRYRITVLAGNVVQASGVQDLGRAVRAIRLAGDESWEVAIEEYRASRPPYIHSASFREAHDAASDAFAAFADRVAPFRGADAPAAELAAYVLWSTTVNPRGFLTRPSVLMSKHWMDKVWSWDHCFNALALAEGEPDLAWDQFMSVFDHQDEHGALPDSVTHSEVLYNFVKPPIHGWALQQVRRRLGRPLTGGELSDAYSRLAAWTCFWLTERRVPGHALPHYQHGNDSGWDNATSFADERVIETADLAAFLILQLETLADLAVEVGRAEESATWTAHADELTAAVVSELWNGERFTARSVTSGRRWSSDSLLDLMPIVLGERLPGPVRDRLATAIARHRAPAGLATELSTSPLYQPDGYWRGPVWAPSTVLIEDGLRRAGHERLADDISHRFRTVCERSGFAENFDALSGEGLRDRAYTWTASAYLLLAAQHIERATLTLAQPPNSTAIPVTD